LDFRTSSAFAVGFLRLDDRRGSLSSSAPPSASSSSDSSEGMSEILALVRSPLGVRGAKRFGFFGVVPFTDGVAARFFGERASRGSSVVGSRFAERVAEGDGDAIWLLALFEGVDGWDSADERRRFGIGLVGLAAAPRFVTRVCEMDQAEAVESWRVFGSRVWTFC
jgi:hypothetical protein